MKFNTVYNKENHLWVTLSDQCGGAGPASLDYIDTGFVQIFGFKIQDFFQTFFHNNNFFFQTQGYQICDQSRNEQSFSLWCAETKVRAKKLKTFFIIFPDFISIFQTFFEVLKIARQISWLFQDFKILYEPY